MRQKTLIQSRAPGSLSKVRFLKCTNIWILNPISTDGGGERVFLDPSFVFSCNVLFLSQFPLNLVTFPKI